MTLPGVLLVEEDAAPPSAPRLRLATPFLVGELQRGPETPVIVRSMRDLQKFCGVRTTDSAPTHDWLDAYFREGGSSTYVTPLRGPAFGPTVTLATSAAADDIIDTASPHGFEVGDIVQFPSLTGGSGLSTDTDYYVIAANLGSTTFKVSTTAGGSAVNFTTDITAGAVAEKGAAAATVTLNDGSAQPGIAVTALEKGSWANGATDGLAVDIDTSGSDFEVKIYLGGTTDADIVERSGLVADGAAAAAWAAANSQYVSIVAGAGGDPAATGSPQNLVGGSDGFDLITQTEIDQATDRYTADLGPGALVFPGRTSTTVHIAAAAAAKARNRMVKADLPPTENVVSIQTHMATLTADENADRFDALLPRLECPGLTPGSTRTVPGSVLRCAAESRNDAAGISPNQAAAGKWGVARYCTVPTITWDDSDLEALNNVGANVIREVDGILKVYGMRTAVDPQDNPAGVLLGAGRLRMAVHEIARFRAELYVFAEIDAGGVVLGNLKGDIQGDILSRYSTSLWPVNADGDLLTVTAELVDGDDPGTYVLEVLVLFRPAGAAEVVRETISRTIIPT